MVREVAALCAASIVSVSPAQAQLFWKSPDVSGLPLVGYEQGMGVPLPNATPVEERAAIVWSMRSGLNVAALQCGFEPTLRTLENYNAMLSDHNAELTASFNTLAGYFKRNNKTPKAAMTALDIYGTRTYSSFSTVRAQLGFCNAAGRVGRIALFTPKGSFATFAKEHLRELRNSLVAQGEQQFTRYRPSISVMLPRLEAACWKKKNEYNPVCGLVPG